MSITEMKEIKRELTKIIYNFNDFVVNAYFKDFEKFKIEIEKLNKTKLSLLSIKEIKALNYINKINSYDLEYIIKKI